MGHTKRVAAVLLVAVAACASPATHGTVAGLQFNAAHDEIRLECFSYDTKTGACTTLLPVTDHYPDVWTVTFEGPDSDGDVRDFDTDVSQPIYARCHIADAFVHADKPTAHCERGGGSG